MAVAGFLNSFWGKVRNTKGIGGHARDVFFQKFAKGSFFVFKPEATGLNPVHLMMRCKHWKCLLLYGWISARVVDPKLVLLFCKVKQIPALQYFI